MFMCNIVFMSDPVLGYYVIMEDDGAQVFGTYDDTNPDYIEMMKDELSQYMCSDDLGVVTARYDEINELLENETERVGDNELYAAVGIGLALGELVEELSEESAVDADPGRYATKTVDSTKEWREDLDEKDYFFITAAKVGNRGSIASAFKPLEDY